MGRDFKLVPLSNSEIVSIHAPAWGATTHTSSSITYSSCFNSRARMGRDATSCLTISTWKRFQFTRPHGARLKLSYTSTTAHVFQFTRPHGARLNLLDGVRAFRVFQFTRPHGARLIQCDDDTGLNVFQFTRPHGARLILHWYQM